MSCRQFARTRGFTLIEMLIATLVTMMVSGAVAAVVNPAQRAFRAQDEAADLHQRIRFAADAFASDLRAATAVRPYRVGAVRDDGMAGIHYRADTIAVLGVPSEPLSVDRDGMRTYYLRREPASGSFELMRYDGELSDLPVIQHLVSLAFSFAGVTVLPGTGLTPIDPAEMVDGPWTEDAWHRQFDADLLRIRRIRVAARFESTAPAFRQLVPGEDLILDVSMRHAMR